MTVDIISEELEFFKAAATRMRWLINTAILISILITLHIYLENYSLQNQQLRGIYYNRFIHQIVPYRLCGGTIFNEINKFHDRPEAEREEQKNNIINENIECSTNNISETLRKELLATSLMEIIKNYSALEYELQLNERTLNDEKLSERTIPLLNMEVPANDFVIAMAITSMFIVIGVWMNLRGLHAALLSLCRHKNVDILRVAQLNTVFLTYSEVGGNKFARRVRALSMWFPFISIASATFIVFGPVVQEQVFSASVNVTADKLVVSNAVVAAFSAVSLIVCATHFWMATKCYNAMKEIDVIFENHLVQA